MCMPQMNGIEASRLIRAKMPDIVIILMSLHADILNEDEVRKAGISAKISKDRAGSELLPTVRALLNLPGTARVA
jgi:DNA-binding NarL/FixJ family response regulator